MLLLMFFSLFLPFGVLFLWNPGGWADEFKSEIERQGLRRSLIAAVAVGWVVVGALAFVAAVRSTIN